MNDLVQLVPIPAKPRILVLGSGNIAHQTIAKLDSLSYDVTHISSDKFREIETTVVQESSLQYACQVLTGAGIKNTSAICIVDKDDTVNIFLLMCALSLNPEVLTVISLVDPGLTASFTLSNHNVRIINPGTGAAYACINNISQINIRDIEDKNPKNNKNLMSFRQTRDFLTLNLVILSVIIFTAGSLFFKLTENISWIDSAYLMATTATSINFSDATIQNQNHLVKIGRTMLILGTYSFVIYLFAIIMDQIVDRRAAIAIMGHKRYKKSGHIVICGLGRIAFQVTMELTRLGYAVVIVTNDNTSKYIDLLRANGIIVYIGNATMPNILEEVGIQRATALLSLINHDLTNLEIGLVARSIRPSLRLILRIFDKDVAREIKIQLNINYTLSVSDITSDLILDILINNIIYFDETA